MAGKGRVNNPLNIITEEHVKATLNADKGDAAHLISFTTSNCVESGDNMATIVTRLKVHFHQKGQHDQEMSEVSYIVKINPCREFGLPEEFNHMLFDKEIEFYTKIMPGLNSLLISAGQDAIRAPRFVYSCLEPFKELIFLEDLGAKGYEMHNKFKGQDEAHVRLVMQELARLHASSYLLQMQLPKRSLTDKHLSLKKDWLNVTGEQKKGLSSMMAGNYDNAVVILRMIPGYEKVAKWIEDNTPKCLDIFHEQTRSVPPFEVICHGDCWNNNMLFRYNDDGTPAEVMLIDHQVTRVASPCTDLSYFLYTSVASEVRRPCLDSFLACYYRTFSSVVKAAGVETPFSESELRQEFRDKMKYGFMFSLIFLPFIVVGSSEAIPSAEDIVSMDTKERLKAWREENLKEGMLEKNPLVRSRILDTLDDMVEEGVIS